MPFSFPHAWGTITQTDGGEACSPVNRLCSPLYRAPFSLRTPPTLGAIPWSPVWVPSLFTGGSWQPVDQTPKRYEQPSPRSGVQNLENPFLPLVLSTLSPSFYGTSPGRVAKNVFPPVPLLDRENWEDAMKWRWYIISMNTGRGAQESGLRVALCA